VVREPAESFQVNRSLIMEALMYLRAAELVVSKASRFTVMPLSLDRIRE